MMLRILKVIAAVSAVLGIMIFAAPSPALANLEIQMSTDGGATYTVEAQAASGGTATFTGTVGGLSFNVTATDSNSPGAPTKAILEGTTLNVQNDTASTATVLVKLGDTGFTAPTAPPTVMMSSHIGGSVTTGGASNALTFQSYVDPANGQNTQAGTTTGAQSPNITVATGSFSSDAFKTIPTLASPYSITEFFSITLSAAGRFGFQSNTQLTPLPEPATMAGALSALPMLGLYYLRRRRARA